jgi:hypothetical protein
MRLRRTSRAVLAGVLGALVFAAVASATPSRSASHKTARTTSCYPSNEFSLVAQSLPGSEFGAFWAASSGSGDGTASDAPNITKHVTWALSTKVTGNAPDWKGTAPDFAATKGSLNGSLKLTLTWGVNKKIRFTSRCLAEIVIEDDGGGDQIIEAEFEGLMGKQPAIASILITGDAKAGTVSSFNVGLEKGVTCSEQSQGEISVAGSGTGSLSQNPALASGANRGRAALPAPWTGANPCPDVFFG